MNATLVAHFRHLAALWLFGAAALAATTWVCVAFNLGFTATSFAFLVIIVLLSLLDSLISSLFFSVLAVVCLDYFFVPPLYTLFVYSAQDVWALATFVLASVTITTQVRRVRSLGEQQREQAGLLDLTWDSIVVRDLNDVITYWNRGAEELYGWRSEQAIGRVTHELLQTSFPRPLAEIMQELIAVGRWEGELVHTRRDGATVVVASRWSVRSDRAGRRVGTLETNNDITERKRAEEALGRSQAAYLAEAQQLSATGSLGWNVESGELFWSAESYRIFGYEPTLQPTIPLVLQRVHPDDVEAVQQAIDQATRSHEALEIEHRLLMPDGEVRHVRVVAHPLPDEPAQFIGALMDITASVRAQEALEKLQSDFAHWARISVLGELTASIAHEVSQPLMAISVNAMAGERWLKRPDPDIAALREITASIAADAARASGIVTRVRDMAARRGPELTALSINAAVREAVRFLRHELVAQRVDVRLELAEDLPPVLGDATQLQQVVVNLAMNAAQAMAQSNAATRQLVVRTAVADGAVTVALEDTGPGIAADHQSRLFESFFTTKDSGMGMGLPICRSIIESHGGRIAACNRPEGGAQFTFTLPNAPAE